ncbi:uncharacterized protein LOC121853710 isoform X3 [Homarus americanus]|uniref:uncharacterized protein LOC121853710 isoform X3 n=1 Tax=Homarus americanus TaxID=6706 RepID=UPI001C444293|nr:uncharacterized protein LOC121853710 isoform X3 [Homarus americanus]
MQCVSLLLVVMLAALASSAETEEGAPTTTIDPSTAAKERKEEDDVSWWVAGCRYYCIWNKRPYCCDDGSGPLPPDHDVHGGIFCPPTDDHICKKDGIYLATQAIKTARYSGSLPLVKGQPKDQKMCASDGYCLEDEKCCPSPCAGRHICLPALEPTDDEEDGELEQEENDEDEDETQEEENEDGNLVQEEEDEEYSDTVQEEEEEGLEYDEELDDEEPLEEEE